MFKFIKELLFGKVDEPAALPQILSNLRTNRLSGQSHIDEIEMKLDRAYVHGLLSQNQYDVAQEELYQYHKGIVGTHYTIS